MSVTILDGGMGQELVARAEKQATKFWATEIMRDQPELVGAIHDDYFNAGAEVATTNSYAIHRDRFEGTEFEPQFVDLLIQACKTAAAARDKNGSGAIAGSMGPIGWSYRPEACPPVDIAAPLYREIAEVQKEYVDNYLVETASSIEQARGALMGIHDLGKPVWVGFTVDDANGKTLRSGEAVSDILPLIEEFGVDAVLINCSTPEAVDQAMPILSNANCAFGAYANGFTKITDSFKKGATAVDLLTARQDLDPNAYADFAEKWVKMGATIIGGCCEVGPAHIVELARRFS